MYLFIYLFIFSVLGNNKITEHSLLPPIIYLFINLFFKFIPKIILGDERLEIRLFQYKYVLEI